METPPTAGFMQEDNGSYSSIRLMSFIALIASIVFGYLTIKLAGDQAANGIYITFAFLTSAFAPKVAQKAFEEKLSVRHETTNVRTEKSSSPS